MKRSFLLLAALLLAACSGEEAPESESFPSVLADSWVRFYPPTETPDTLILRADGTVGGSTAGLDEFGFAMTYWQIADSLMLMPGGFCIGTGWSGTVVGHPRPGSPEDTAFFLRPRAMCQGFAVIGDTLALANQNRTVFVRASAAGDLQRLRRRFQRPDGPGISAGAPPPGVRVRGIPAPQ